MCRHHDYDVYDLIRDDDYNILDVRLLTKRIVDLWPVHPEFCLPLGLPPFGSFPTVILFLRISREMCATNLIPIDQAIPEKTDHQKVVEVANKKVLVSKEKKRVQTVKADARKKKNKKRPDGDGEGSSLKLKRRKSKASNYSYEEEEVHELFQKPPSKIIPETQENNLELVHMSSNESGNESIHDLIEEEHERPPTMDLFVNLVEISLEVKRDNLFVNDSKADDANHPVKNPEEGSSRSGGCHYEEGKSSRIVYVPQWTLMSKCRVDTLEKCHEMMIHLATSVVQEDHNALPSRIALERAWFTLGRVTMTQADIYHRHESLLDDYFIMAETHKECSNTRKLLLQTAKKEASEWRKECEDLIMKLRQGEVARFYYIRELLPSVVSRLLNNYKYKKSLSDSFNLAIASGWAKGLAIGRSDEEFVPVFKETEGFDNYSKNKLYPLYDKRFENQYPYITKIAKGRINLEEPPWQSFQAQSIRSSNAIALDSPNLLVLITGTSQRRQHGKSESDSYYLSD
nr:hypothetical protein [Tanacetum cinerariifolium]